MEQFGGLNFENGLGKPCVWRIEKGEKMEWNGMRRMVFPNGGKKVEKNEKME